METTPVKSIVPVFLIFISMLLGWFTYSVIGFTKAIQTQSWPTTQGTVVSSEVKKVASKGTHQYQPVVYYYYEIGAETYSSTKYSSTGARGSSQWANQVISGYPDEATITVHYNPTNPKQSVLITGLQYDNYWMTGLSAFFLGVVLLAFIKQLQKRKIAA